MAERTEGLPIDEFINALSSQLDRVQSAMALKARAGLPLTFAVKDISLDLRAHIDMVGSVVRIRPADAREGEASILRIALTTITRPMIEENTMQLSADVEEESIEDALGEEISEEERRRLEWAGIHTVRQLRELQDRSGERSLERVAQIPALRLRRALEQAARPRVSLVQPERADDGTTLLRIRGRNLLGEGAPQVRLADTNLPVLQANPRELLVSPLGLDLRGTLEVETAAGEIVATMLGAEEEV
jgi:hypothetical protein